jgi:trans-2,3-dihydro-3-hydroxyanthranilate isomerase
MRDTIASSSCGRHFEHYFVAAQKIRVIRMNSPKFFITDVFTNKKYGGNQLATFIDCEHLSDHEMQQIAKELNFSETTFITSRTPREGGYDVRIFTPAAEVEFAGHPTLGTAYIIREKLHLTASNIVTLNLRIGKIPVTFAEVSAQESLLWMKQTPPKFGNTHNADRLARVLGIEVSDIETRSPIEEVSTGFPTLIVPLTSLAAIKRVKINRAEYFTLVQDAWAKVILVYSPESYEPVHDLSVRVFADFYGISEDAATGSSNGSLAAYLLRHQTFGSSNLDVKVGQGYEMGRPSTLALNANHAEGEMEIFVGGRVIPVAEGVWGT